MQEELSFAKIIQKPENIHEDADIEIMNDNYHLLKSIIDKFVFSEYPRHPELFSVLFSDPDFVTVLKYHLECQRITNLEKVVFTEYSKADMERLIKMGIVKSWRKDSNKLLVIHTFNKNICFINLFSNEWGLLASFLFAFLIVLC